MPEHLTGQGADAMNRGVGTRLLLSCIVLAAVGAVAGLATHASFTDSTTASHGVSTGTVEIDLGATGAATNRLDIPATNVAPGDSIERSVDLINTSSLALASTSLTTSAPVSSLLDTDTTNGFQMQIDRCSVPWSEGGVAPAYTYTCGGTTSIVVPTRPVVGAAIALANVITTAGGGTNHLRVMLTLPSTADNSFQGLSSDLQFDFQAVQRAATNR